MRHLVFRATSCGLPAQDAPNDRQDGGRDDTDGSTDRQSPEAPAEGWRDHTEKTADSGVEAESDWIQNRVPLFHVQPNSRSPCSSITCLALATEASLAAVSS